MLTEPAVDVFVDKNSPLIISNQHLSILRVAVTLCDKTHSIPFGVYGTKVRIGPREADGEELASVIVALGFLPGEDRTVRADQLSSRQALRSPCGGATILEKDRRRAFST